jgi:hypothetical protein
MNDRKAAKRLIEYKIERDSTLMHGDAVSAAPERCRRDNG